ncbi:MAG: polysaccharide biosynthesis tyrosine autokinase [Alphaproteobacteria bacterium]|nr:polysaccharide biosynthesis tyrosine autokinase [Alphaproteobacteria bacterium]
MKQDSLLMTDDLRDLWLFLHRKWKLIIQITLGVLWVALMLALFLPARFRAETVIIIDPRKTHATNIEDVVSTLQPNSDAIRSEIDIIMSRAIIDPVIAGQDLAGDPDYRPGPSLMRKVFGYFGLGIEDPAKIESEKLSKLANKLLKNLDAENDGRSLSIIVSYRDQVSERAAKIVNAVANEYLNNQLDVKYDAGRRVNMWLEKRMEALRNEVRAKEKAVEDFKSANNLIGSGDETVTQQQLGELNKKLSEARTERFQAEAKLKSISGIERGKLETSSVVLSSDLIQKLRQQEAEVLRKAAEFENRYGPLHPTIINARNELREIRGKIGEEIQKVSQAMKNDFDIAERKVASLESEMANLEGKTGEGNQAMVALRQLQREASASRSLYEGFMERSKQIAEQMSLQKPDARIVAPAAIPLKPYFPDLPIFLALGLALGAVIGFLVAFVLEYMDRGFRSTREIEELYGVTGIGLTPLAEVTEGVLLHDYILEKPLSSYAESVRAIRTAIHFSNVDTPPKVIMITSALPGEGKTFFSASLARVMAMSGTKVVLIEADMRRPVMADMLKLDKKKPDLAMVLAHDATYDQAIQKDKSGADVIIARDNTPHPQDLLGSKQMQLLIEIMRLKYDMVIIDTPPLMALSDATVIAAKVADTTIFTVRWATTPREVVGECLNKLKGFNVNLAGVVLTQVDLTKQKHYGHGDFGAYYGRYKHYYKD